MYSVKVTLAGKLNEVSSTTIDTSVTKSGFRYFLGKLLFAIESMGWNFITADVYDICMKEYEKEEDRCDTDEAGCWFTLYYKEDDNLSMRVSIKNETD